MFLEKIFMIPNLTLIFASQDINQSIIIDKRF